MSATIKTTTTPRPSPRSEPNRTQQRETTPDASFGTRAITWLSDYPQHKWLSALLRTFCPILHVGKAALVFRDEDVRDVLAHNTEFPVPWGKRMQALTGGRNFVLGMPENNHYRLNYSQLTQAFKRDDVSKHVAPLAAECSQSILCGTQRLDAVRDLIWKVPAQLCEHYFGISGPDWLQLARWSIDMSGYLFSPGQPSAASTQQAMAAANEFRTAIRASMRAAPHISRPGLVLPRFMQMQRLNPAQLPDDVIEAHLFGMVTGFIPTNVLAGGNILDTLLRQKEFMAHARRAALADDDDLLWRCLRETLRFRHINLGIFRTCEGNYKLAAGTRREKLIRSGTSVLACTQSAMFDRRRVTHPGKFDPHRDADDYLIFGYGQHWCLGAFIAIAQLTQTFKALLRTDGLRRVAGEAGKMRRIGLFPAHLEVEYDA